MCADELKSGKITFSDFIKDLSEELKENPEWGDGNIEFTTIDGGDLKYSSISILKNGDIRINLDIDPKNKITLKRFIKDLTKKSKNNPDWGNKELEFCAMDRGGLEYLSVYDSDDEKSIYVDVGTEEDNDEWNKMATGSLEGGMR